MYTYMCMRTCACIQVYKLTHFLEILEASPVGGS